MNKIEGLSVNHFEYQFNEDRVEVRHEGEVLGVITPVAQQQFSFLKGLIRDKVSLTVGDRTVEVFRSDWEEAVAPRVRLLDEMQSFNPQTREEARKCLRVFLASHQLNEDMIFNQGAGNRVRNSAMQVFKLLNVARKVSLQSGRCNVLLLSVLENRMAIAAPTAGQVAVNAMNDLRLQARKNAVHQLVGQAFGGRDIKGNLNAYLQSRGINEQLLFSTDLKNEVVLENAERACDELGKLLSEIRHLPGVSSQLLSRTERLLQNGLHILGPEHLQKWKEEEQLRLQGVIQKVMNDNGISEEYKVKQLLASEGINADFIMQTAASSTSSSQTSPIELERQANVQRAKGVIFEALRLWGHGKISGQPVLDALVEYGKAVCCELGDEQALEMTQWIRQVMVDFWLNGGKEDHQNTTLVLSNIERKLLTANKYSDFTEILDEVTYLKDYLDGALPLVDLMVETAQNEEYSFDETEKHAFLEYFDGAGAFYQSIRDYQQQIIDRMVGLEKPLYAEIQKIKDISGDCEMILKYFPMGYGTDTSEIEVLFDPPERGNGEPEYDYLFKVKMVGDYDSGLNYLIHRFTKDEFPKGDKSLKDEMSVRTVAYRKRDPSSEENRTKLQIWKKWSQEEEWERRCYASDWRGTRLAVFSFDLSMPSEEVMSRLEQHLKEVKWFAPDYMGMILVGTKLDTLQGDPMAKQKLMDLKRFAEKHNLPYCATSALDGYGIEKFGKVMTYALHQLIDSASQAASSS